MKKILVILIMTGAAYNCLAQTTWEVPSIQKEKLSPVAFTESMEKSGAEIFNKNCMSCHGTPGQNNPIALIPSPRDPAGERFQNNTDGALFYKINEGRVTMPSFKNALSKADIWSTIAYIRSFNSKYVQKTAEKIETNIPEGTVLSMNIAYNKNSETINVTLSGTLNNKVSPIGGVNIKLLAKRYFGYLTIGESQTTNKQGVASFYWNGKLPGDSTGNILFKAQFEDPETYGETSTEKTLAIGKVNNMPPLNKERAMWNTVKKAPLWIIIGYTGAVITVWFFIFYVLFALKKIFTLGKEPISDEEKLA
jgi:mono/diheme cytochrome c family protein